MKAWKMTRVPKSLRSIPGGIICLLLLVPTSGLIIHLKIQHAPETSSSRRRVLTAIPSSFYAILFSSVEKSSAVTLSPSLPPRDVDVGGGFDLLSERTIAGDVIYPGSMQGRWSCERVVVKVEGESFQAETAFKILGGKQKPEPGIKEQFQTNFVQSPVVGSTGVVVDRGFEMHSRLGTGDVQWDVADPNVLKYDKIMLRVVKRSVELPNDQGFGSDELVRVDDSLITRAVQVKRRYRRAFDDDGNRVVEGLEIMKTFRVLDGVAGIEFPTSTTKSTIRLVRQV